MKTRMGCPNCHKEGIEVNPWGSGKNKWEAFSLLCESCEKLFILDFRHAVELVFEDQESE